MKGKINCPHTTVLDISKDLLGRIADLEVLIGEELTATRCCECPECNVLSGGGSLSAHVPGNNPSGKCEAVDFLVHAGNVFPIVKGMIELDFQGVGIKRKSGSSGFCHADIAVSSVRRPRPRLWTY